MAMNVTPFQSSDNFNMAGFNNMISQINSGVDNEISSVMTSVASKLQIEKQTYVGNGTRGNNSANPVSVTFSIKPTLVIIVPDATGQGQGKEILGLFVRGQQYSYDLYNVPDSKSTHYLSVTWSDNGLSFWCYDSSSIGAQVKEQFNSPNTTYIAYAIG